MIWVTGAQCRGSTLCDYMKLVSCWFSASSDDDVLSCTSESCSDRRRSSVVRLLRNICQQWFVQVSSTFFIHILQFWMLTGITQSCTSVVCNKIINKSALYYIYRFFDNSILFFTGWLTMKLSSVNQLPTFPWKLYLASVLSMIRAFGNG